MCHDNLAKVLRRVSSVFVAQQGACRRIKVKSVNFRNLDDAGALYTLDDGWLQRHEILVAKCG